MAAFPEHRMSIITLGVKDRAAMTAWYTDVLGFQNFGPEGITMFDMGGFVFGLWENDKLADDAGQPLGEQSGFKGVALAFNARSEAEVDAIFAALEKAEGATITKAPHKAFWGGYSGYFADPEGNAWEVAFNPFWGIADDGQLTLPKAEGA